MSGAKLHLAGPDDADRVTSLVTAFHAEEEMGTDEAHIRAAIAPLLAGSPHGEIYLAGPRRAPVGYACVIYGWSIEFGALDTYIDELYLRPAVRGRGMGTDILNALFAILSEKGAKSVFLSVDHDNEVGQKLYARAGFEPRSKYELLCRTLP